MEFHHWLIEKRVLLVSVNTNDVDQTKAGIGKTSEMLREGIASTHLIVDMSSVSTFPKGIPVPLNQIREMNENRENAWTIIVTTRPIVRFFGAVASKLLGGNFTTAITVDEALTIIRHHDLSLQALPTQKQATQELEVLPIKVI